MRQPPFEIGSILRHETGVVIQLERYGTQLVPALRLTISGSNTKRVPNYRYLYGFELENGSSFEGLTSEFELIQTNTENE